MGVLLCYPREVRDSAFRRHQRRGAHAMFVIYTYPVRSTLSAVDRWPVLVDKFRVEFGEEKGIISSVSVTVRLDDDVPLPKVSPSNDQKVKLHIDVGKSAHNDEVTNYLMVVQGMLS